MTWASLGWRGYCSCAGLSLPSGHLIIPIKAPHLQSFSILQAARLCRKAQEKGPNLIPKVGPTAPKQRSNDRFIVVSFITDKPINRPIYEFILYTKFVETVTCNVNTFFFSSPVYHCDRANQFNRMTMISSFTATVILSSSQTTPGNDIWEIDKIYGYIAHVLEILATIID